MDLIVARLRRKPLPTRQSNSFTEEWLARG